MYRFVQQPAFLLCLRLGVCSVFVYLVALMGVLQAFATDAVNDGLSEVALKVYQGKQKPSALPTVVSTPLVLPALLTPRTLLPLVEQRHPSLTMAQLSVQSAQAKQQQASGNFDPVLQGGSSYKRFNTSTKPETALNGFEQEVVVQQRLRSGGVIEGGWQQHRGDLSSSLSPTGEGGEWGVSLKQPLLQYRGINPQLLQERQAGLSVQLAEVAQALTRLDVLTDAQHAYWVWQEARNTLLIQQQLVTLASQRVAQVESRATKGDLPLVDVLEAKQTLQRRQVARTKATESLLKQGYQLLWFLWPTTDQWPTLATQLTQLEMPPLQSQWLTYTMPKVVQPTAVTENVLHALLHRPELEQQALTKQLKTLDLSLAKTQLLPKLDAIISPGYQVGANGIGGTLKAGLSFSVPLRNRTALGKVRLATVDLATVDVKTQMLLQDIHLKLETLAMQWQQGWQQAQQAYEAWQQSEALAVAERRRFELGDSTLFLLNRRESDAAMAQESWLQAFVDTQHTLVELQRVMGTVQR